MPSVSIFPFMRMGDEVLPLTDEDVIKCESYGRPSTKMRYARRGGCQGPLSRANLGAVRTRPVRLAWWCISQATVLW